MTQKSGRPKKSAADSRNVVIATRVTAAEAELIEAKAIAAGMTVSQYLRLTALDERGAFRPRPRDFRNEIHLRAIAELNRTGVNLWQIVRHLNRGGSVPNDLTEAIDEVRDAVAYLADY